MRGIIDCEMRIGDEVFVHGYIDEIRNDTIIIRNVGGYFGTSRDEVFYYEDDGYGTMNEADRKTEPITHDDYIESGNDYLEARCLNCNNAKACKEKHWEGCIYEPKDEKTCETCRHWKFIAKEFQCETTKCQGYEPKTEPQTEREGE